MDVEKFNPLDRLNIGLEVLKASLDTIVFPRLYAVAEY